MFFITVIHSLYLLLRGFTCLNLCSFVVNLKNEKCHSKHYVTLKYADFFNHFFLHKFKVIQHCQKNQVL